MTQTNSSTLLEGKGSFSFLLPDTYLALTLVLANLSMSCWFNTAENRPRQKKEKPQTEKQNMNILC